MGITSKVNSLSDSEFALLVENCTTVKEIALKLGYSTGRAARWRITERIDRQNLDVSHFRNWIQYKNTPTEQLLTKNSTRNNQTIRKRLLKDGMLKYECVHCGNNGTHNGKPLVLHMDHIDGNSRNNELSNLRILCPNCHSQTDTYAGRNIKKSMG